MNIWLTGCQDHFHKVETFLKEGSICWEPAVLGLLTASLFIWFLPFQTHFNLYSLPSHYLSSLLSHAHIYPSSFLLHPHPCPCLYPPMTTHDKRLPFPMVLMEEKVNLTHTAPTTDWWNQDPMESEWAKIFNYVSLGFLPSHFYMEELGKCPPFLNPLAQE